MEGDRSAQVQREKTAISTPSRVFEPLMDCRDAAKLLRVHSKTVLKMARAGDLPGIRFGKLWRFRACDLDEWLRARVSCQHHPCR